jgi:hypothetical protein
VTTLALAAKLLARDKRFSRALIALGLVLTGSLVASAVLISSVQRAVLDGTEADYAGYQTFVQVVRPAGLALLRRSDGVHPTWVTSATLTAAERAAPISLRVSEGRLPLVVIAGRKPEAAGELAVTPEVMDELGVRLNSPIQGETSSGTRLDLQVVGLVVDPRDRSTRAGIMLGELVDQEPTAWLSDDDVFYDPSIAAGLKAGDIRGRTVELLAQDQVGNGISPVLGALRSALPGLSITLVILGAVLTASLVSTQRRHQDGMQAAGMTSSRARRVIRLATIGGLGIASGGAAGAVLLLFWLGRSAVSAAVNQYWLGLGVNWAQLLAIIVLVPPAILLIANALGRLQSSRPRPFMLPVPAWLALLGTGAVLIVLPGLLRSSRELALVGGLLLTLGVAGLAASALAHSRRPVRRRLLTQLVSSAVGPSLLVALVAFALSTYVATTLKSLDFAEGSSTALQPAGSIMIDGTSRRVVNDVVEVYRGVGGRGDLVYELADDRTRPVRVTSAALAECYEKSDAIDPGDLLQSCGPSRTLVPINVVAFSSAIPAGAAVAVDPSLTESGDLGFLYPPDKLGQRWEVEIIRGQAQPRKDLGGNLPAALFPVDSTLAQRLGIKPGGGYGVVLLGLTELPPRRQAEVRYAVSQLAGTAGVSEQRGQDLSGERALVTLVAYAGSALLAAMLWVVGQALLAAFSRTDRSLAAAGASPQYRGRLYAHLLALPVALVAGAVLASRLVASALVPPAPGPFGLLWLLPLVFAVPVLTARWLLTFRHPEV